MRSPLSFTALLLVLVLTAGAAALPSGQATKTVFLSIVDQSGKPVTGILPGEAALGEDNLRREVTGFKAATSPLSVALLVDTTLEMEKVIRDFRVSLLSFVRRIQSASPDAEIMLMEFGQAAVPLTRFTSNTADLEKPISRLYPKREAAAVLLEAIGESSRMLGKRQSPRRAIVILNLEPSIEQSALRPNQVLEELRKSGASIWAVSLHQGTLRNLPRGVVLPVLAQNTGGNIERVQTSNVLEANLLAIADAILGQYELTYIRPADAGTPKVLQVRIGRAGLNVRAPSWPPQ